MGTFGGIGLPEMVTGLIQSIIDVNAPYNAVDAQLYGTKAFLNNEGEMNAVHNYNQPKLTSPFYTMDQDGNRVWHTPALGTKTQRNYYQAHPDELTQRLSDQTKGMQSQMENKEPSLLNKLF